MNYHLITYNLVNNCLFFFIYERCERGDIIFSSCLNVSAPRKKQQAERLHDEINCDGHALIKGLSTFFIQNDSWFVIVLHIHPRAAYVPHVNFGTQCALYNCVALRCESRMNNCWPLIECIIFVLTDRQLYIYVSGHTEKTITRRLLANRNWPITHSLKQWFAHDHSMCLIGIH